jgi:hypothetical protein
VTPTNPFDEVIAHPRSVAARRRLARNWRESGDRRAELIDRQLREHDGLGLLSMDTVPYEIDDLVEQHGREWAGRIADVTNDYGYELGLVADINIDGDKFVHHGDELVRLAPIVQISLEAPIDLRQVSATRALSQMATLYIAGGPWLNDDAVVAFADSPYVRGLRAIEFRNGQIGERGLRALAGSPNLRDVVYIDLTGNPCRGMSPDGIRSLEIMDKYYLVGDAGLPYLREAQEAAAVSYDTFGLHEWPPSDQKLSYDQT